MRNIIATMVLLSLIGCSSDDNSSVSIETICNTNQQAGDIILDTDDSTGSLELREKFNVYVTSSRTSKTILTGSPIGNLYVQGNNNQLTFEPNVTVDYVCVSGSDNTLLVPSDTRISIDRDTGSGNLLVEY